MSDRERPSGEAGLPARKAAGPSASGASDPPRLSAVASAKTEAGHQGTLRELPFATRPVLQALRHESGDKAASVASRHPTRQQFVISRVRVSHMCANSQFDCLGLLTPWPLPSGQRDPEYFWQACSAIARCSSLGHPGNRSPTRRANCSTVLGIQFLPLFDSALATQLPGFCIRETLLLRPCEGSFLYQQTLPLVALS